MTGWDRGADWSRDALKRIVVLLFGRGKVSELMGDVAKGIKSFKKGMADDDDDIAPAKPATRIEGHRVPEQDAPTATSEEKTKA